MKYKRCNSSEFNFKYLYSEKNFKYLLQNMVKKKKLNNI